MMQVEVKIAPVIGGFVITYPRLADNGGVEFVEFVQEVATTSGKAMRVAKAAVDAFSLVTKSKDDAAE
jgi:hypothetical protein